MFDRQKIGKKYADQKMRESNAEKARIDEENPFRYGADAFLEVDRRPTFLIHYTHFDRVARQAKSIFHRSEQIVGERGFFRTMHFWFHDIKTSRAAI